MRMFWGMTVVAAFVACVGEDAQPTGEPSVDAGAIPDAGSISGQPVMDADIADAGPACDPTRDFEVVEAGPFADLNTASDERHVSLTKDELTAYFERDATIWIASRSDTSKPFETPRVLATVSDKTAHSPSISRNGDVLYFFADRGGGNDLWYSTLDSHNDFGIPQLVRAAKDAAIPGADPFVDEEGSEAYFTELPTDAGDPDSGFFLRKAPVTSIAIWGAATRIGNAIDDYPDAAGRRVANNPVVSRDGTKLYFASKRSSASGVFRSTRASREDDWGPPVALAISQNPNDGTSWVSDDDCHLYFWRIGADQHGDLMLAARPR